MMNTLRRLRRRARTALAITGLATALALAPAGMIPTRTATEPAAPAAVWQPPALPEGDLALRVDPAPGNAVMAPSRAETRSFVSAVLSRSMPYLVYLPPGYDTRPDTRYPVLYMLHGMGGTAAEWYGYGLFDAADALIRTGVIPALIIVLPQGDQSYWVDQAGGEQWGRYVIADVVTMIDARYRTQARPERRAIGGLSMGAHGALQLALNYPGVFGIVGVHSPSLRGFSDRLPYFGDDDYFAAHNPPQLLDTFPERARALHLWLDAGDEDPWLPAVDALRLELDDLKIPYEWHSYPGIHDGPYWTAHVSDYLRWYGEALAAGEAVAVETP